MPLVDHWLSWKERSQPPACLTRHTLHTTFVFTLCWRTPHYPAGVRATPSTPAHLPGLRWTWELSRWGWWSNSIHDRDGELWLYLLTCQVRVTIGNSALVSWCICTCTVFMYQRVYLWWSLCTLYLFTRQVRFTIGDSNPCCYTDDMSFQW